MHNPDTDIEFDSAKARSNLSKHKVSFAQAGEALNDPMSTTIEIPDAEGEQRFSTLGADAAGRILVVIHTPRGNRTRLISARKASKGEAGQIMDKEYDFSKGKRGPVLSAEGKTRVPIMLDDDVLAFFRDTAEAQGTGYQSMINAALRNAMNSAKKFAKTANN